MKQKYGFRKVSLALFTLVVGLTGNAQHQRTLPVDPTILPVYDVVAIRISKSASGEARYDTQNGTFTAKNLPFKVLLEYAYEIRSELIVGKLGRIASERFDLMAKISDPNQDVLEKLSEDQRREMLQPVLTSRFRLTVRRETRQLPVYNLVIAKGGAKFLHLQEDSSRPPIGHMTELRPGDAQIADTSLVASGFPTISLAHALSHILDYTVIDKTGLTGKYDFSLNWAPDSQAGVVQDDPTSHIFIALQEQLGLRLERAKGPVDVLVVEHVEEPSEN